MKYISSPYFVDCIIKLLCFIYKINNFIYNYIFEKKWLIIHIQIKLLKGLLHRDNRFLWYFWKFEEFKIFLWIHNYFYNFVKFLRQIKCIKKKIERQRNKNNELYTYLNLEICIIKSNSSLRYNNFLHHLDIFDWNRFSSVYPINRCRIFVALYLY